ncbi:hypothetical protein LTR66_005604 [Elasticomyces elasticus]|nr:hypothetical protein LTR66_005604 [Elasticomyces elasticus]
MGYPRLASFLNSDDNFLICRRFGVLHNRVMLYRQDELDQLEAHLMALDAEDADEDPRALMSRKRDDRREDDLVFRARSMTSLQKPMGRNYTSVFNWMYHNAPLCEPEAEFIKHEDDFVALADAQEGGWFDGFVEDILSMMPCRVTRLLFSTPAQRASTADSLVYLYSKRRIDTLVRLLITMLAVALLMAPVVVLFRAEESDAIKIVVVLLFTVFFSVALSMFTKAKRQEVFAATAA